MISLTKRQATVCSVLCSQGEGVKQTMTQRLTDAHANKKKIVAAFRGMHVSPAKHSFGKCDRRTDRQTDDGQSDPYVSLCFAGDTKTMALKAKWRLKPE